MTTLRMRCMGLRAALLSTAVASSLCWMYIVANKFPLLPVLPCSLTDEMI